MILLKNQYLQFKFKPKKSYFTIILKNLTKKLTYILVIDIF